MTERFVIFLMCAFLYGSSAQRPHWKPQYGTVKHPRHPDLSPIAFPGQIYAINGALWKAKRTCSFISDAQISLCDINDGKSWQQLRHGSYFHPKHFDEGEVFRNGDYFIVDGQVYRAAESGVFNKNTGADSFEGVNVQSQWMKMMLDVIGDTRIGDLIIPGSHDSGTAGVSADSYLVDRNFLFQVAELLEPEIVANWSKTQNLRLGDQLKIGYRNFDLRIADMEEQDGTFRWWHGVTGHTIDEDLDDIARFAAQNPEEIIILQFGHFAKPGNAASATLPIPNRRKDQIADTLLAKLLPYMAPKGSLSDNPTVNQVLATGGNIITVMTDSYIRGKHPAFWPNVIHSAWTGRTNPEDLFKERSSKLETFKNNYADRITEISGCNTPDEKIIIAALITKYGDNENITNIIEIIMPGLLEVKPEMMSFEGLWLDLILLAGEGTNKAGMWKRPPNLYSSGASVHYRGVNSMLPHWLARPQLYKPNLVSVDNVESSTIVETSIQANLGQIPREVSVCHQGNSMDGFYEWDADKKVHALRGNESLDCNTGFVRYQITSSVYTINLNSQEIANKACVNFKEGQYPPDSSLTLEASTDRNNWQLLYKNTVYDMINSNLDLYIRVGLKAQKSSYAYVSMDYNSFGNTCDVPAVAHIINTVHW